MNSIKMKVDRPLQPHSQEELRCEQFIMELRRRKYRSMRVPQNFDELMSSALSLIENESFILGHEIFGEQFGNQGEAAPIFMPHLVCAKSMVRIDSEQSFHLLRNKVWPGSPDNNETSIVVEIVVNQHGNLQKPGFAAEEYFRQDNEKDELDAELSNVLGESDDSLEINAGAAAENLDDLSMYSDLDKHLSPERRRPKQEEIKKDEPTIIFTNGLDLRVDAVDVLSRESPNKFANGNRDNMEVIESSIGCGEISDTQGEQQEEVEMLLETILKAQMKRSRPLNAPETQYVSPDVSVRQIVATPQGPNTATATIDPNFESHLISLAVSELRTLSDAPDMFAISNHYQARIENEAPFKDIA